MIYAVVAGDNMRLAHEKGEIKDRYWNPGNIFDQVHVIVLADDDIGPQAVQRVAGRASLHIHPVGRMHPTSVLRLRGRVDAAVAAIGPDIVRGHGPFLQGYYAVHAARRLGIPCFVSIHDDISIYRRFWTYGRGYARFTAYHLILKLLGWERYVYAHADRLVPKYVAAGRLLARSRYRDKVQVIYNSIHTSRFRDLKPSLSQGERLRIINVGRQFMGKDQRPLISAIRDLDAELTLVGTGPMRKRLVAAAAANGVTDRVHFIDAVPNHELPRLYERHHVFAINIIQPGVSMTVMEAMSLGFPVVISRPRWEDSPEVCGECADVVEATAAGFRNAFLAYLEFPGRVAAMGQRSRQVMEKYGGEKMEVQERDLILSLVRSRAARMPEELS